MKIGDSTVLVTGANRGLGKALVEEALRRGAKRVYAGARQPIAHADRRITLLMLDVTNAAQIGGGRRESRRDRYSHKQCRHLAPERSERPRRARTAPRGQSLCTYDVTLAFLPVLARPQSAIANVLSLASLAAVPFDTLYSISKAAMFSLSQSLRALLAGRRVSVHAALPGPWTLIWHEAWTFRRPLPSLRRKRSSTDWKTGTRRSSLILCRSPLRRAGATVP